MSESIQVNRAIDKKSRGRETMKNCRDNISNLPESIVIHILSLLPTKDAVRTSVLSKDWEYKWTNIQNIDIDDRKLFSHPTTKIKSFVNFVDRILFVCPVKRFRLICSQEYDKVRMATWILAALRRNVDSIEINFKDTDFVVPRCLIDSTSLKNLKLDMQCTIRVPVKHWFSHLTDLYLNRVRIVNELYPNTSQLTFTFPVLESLELQHCIWLNVELVEINAPTLKRVKFHSYFVEARSYQIKISGVRLATFEISGCFLLENIGLTESSVDYAAIGEDKWSCYSLADIHNGLQAEMLFRGFSGLKRLTISAAMFAALSHTKRALPLPRFDELKQIEIGIVHTNKAFLELLHAAPSLETLIIKAQRWCDYMKYDLESVPPCVVSRLKEVRFDGFYGFAEHIRLVKYFLKNALKLEKLLGIRRKKCVENSDVRRFWVLMKRVFEDGNLELGEKIKKYV